jgi:uncharacterized membrane protein
MPLYNQLAGQKVMRIEAISDGVFAIAMTLLVLDIHVPLPKNIHTESDLFEALGDMAPKLLAYFMSFMTLGIFWTGQTVQFTYIHKSDRNLNWLAIFFLMFVSILPFTTAFLSEFIHFKLALGVYWLNILILGILIYIHWVYADRHGFVNLEEPDKTIVSQAVKKRVIVAQALYAVSASLCFINIYLSIILIVAIQLNYALAIFSGRWPKRKK